MTRRMPAIVLAATVLALLFAAATPRPAQAVSFVDKQVQAGSLLIQKYVDDYAVDHQFVVPTKAMVKKGGSLPGSTLIWPSNPWTGKIMAPGTARGTYTYTPAANGLSYKLIVHLSSGNWPLTGGMPRWFKNERDTESRQSLLLLQRYVETAAAFSHVFPATGAFTKDAYAAEVWPTNPWTGQPMALGAGLGDYAYTQKSGGAGYELRVRRAFGGDLVLVESPIGVILTAPVN